MGFGGLSLYATNRARTATSAGTDPTTLSLTGYWRGSYSGSPWNGTASAGASSGRNLVTLVGAPSTGTALNGYTPASFNGTSQALQDNTNTIDNYISSTAYTVQLLLKPSSAVATTGTVYSDPQLVCESGQNWGIAYTTDGITLYHWDGTSLKTVNVALGTGSWAVVDAKYDGTNIKVRVNGGAWSSTAANSLTGFTGNTMYMGVDAALDAFYAGLIEECLVSDTALSDATLDGTRAWFDSRYGLSL